MLARPTRAAAADHGARVLTAQRRPLAALPLRIAAAAVLAGTSTNSAVLVALATASLNT
jgi:hypothetical protein